jgi:hypothetical protein
MEIVDGWITASPEPNVVERLSIMGRLHAETVSRRARSREASARISTP